MRRLLGVLLAFAGLLLFGAAAEAKVTIRVDLGAQVMHVTAPGGAAYRWRISSGKEGFRTPNGRYRPQVLKVYHYSRKYQGAMPHSVFFRGGYAIHGTAEVGRLGRPASHGCIRLHPAHARQLFGLIRQNGMGKTSIAITGTTPGPVYAGKKAKKKVITTAAPKRHAALGGKPETKTKAGKSKPAPAFVPVRSGWRGDRAGGHTPDGPFPRMLR